MPSQTNKIYIYIYGHFHWISRIENKKLYMNVCGVGGRVVGKALDKLKYSLKKVDACMRSSN
jgi:hypothetical protein